MKLNRQTLRKMILNEIKMLNENVKPAAAKGKLVVGNKKFQLSKGVVNLSLSSLDVKTNGSADVVIKKGPITMGKGNVSSDVVSKIVNDAQNKDKFTIQTDQGELIATMV